jgi:hypothetical protein
MTKKGVSPLALITLVLNEQEWMPGEIERQHKELMGVLKSVWRL